MQRPHDIAYVHTVYGPLSVRLVQQLESPGWRHIRDVLDTLPGPSFEDTQQVVLGCVAQYIMSLDIGFN